MNRILEFIRFLKNKNFRLLDSAKIAFFRDRLPEYAVRPMVIGEKIRLRGGGSSDYNVLKEVCVFRKYDFPLRVAPKLIVDAGANTGISTAFFAARFPAAIVVAIEPERGNFRLLRENTKTFPNVVLHNKALSSRKCSMTLQNPGRSWAFRVSPDENGEIRSMTIPDIRGDFHNARVDILKIDIEGSEEALFAENYDEWIYEVGMIVIELHDHIAPRAAKNFFSVISKLPDFRFLVSGECLVILCDRRMLS